MTGINQKGRYGRYIESILTIADFLILNVVFLITAALSPEFLAQGPRTVWLMANITFLLSTTILGHKQISRTIGTEHVLAESVKAVLLHMPLFICGLYFLEFDRIPWTAFVEFYSLLAILLPLWWVISRKIIKFFRRRGRNYSRIVVVGSNPTTRRLCELMDSDVGFGYKVMGVFDTAPTADIPRQLYRGTIDNLDTYMEENGINEVYCTLDHTRTHDASRVIRMAERHVAQIFIVPEIAANIQRNYEMFAIGTMPILSVRHQPLSRMRNRLLKRSFDLAFSTVALICFPIVLIPVSIAIKISSPGPIFFRQMRTGYRGRPFKCFKFRTMRVNNNADTAQATKHDPRKTRVGDFLRHTSIDELPQFFNVFIGNMSVVGPRPHMLAHTEEYGALIDKYMVRHYIKPGITGWAQIHGFRGQTEELWQMERRVEHDVWYIENWSVWLDIKIVFRTIANAIRGEKNAF